MASYLKKFWCVVGAGGHRYDYFCAWMNRTWSEYEFRGVPVAVSEGRVVTYLGGHLIQRRCIRCGTEWEEILVDPNNHGRG